MVQNEKYGSTRHGGILFCLLTPANEVCEGYVFTGVCLSTGGGGGVCSGGHAWQGGIHGRGVCGRGVCMAGGMHCGKGVYVCGRGACMAGGGMHGRGCMHATPPPPPDTMRYGDTVNERAVRILLECILVTLYIYVKLCFSLWVSLVKTKEALWYVVLRKGFLENHETALC